MTKDKYQTAYNALTKLVTSDEYFDREKVVKVLKDVPFNRLEELANGLQIPSYKPTSSGSSGKSWSEIAKDERMSGHNTPMHMQDYYDQEDAVDRRYERDKAEKQARKKRMAQRNLGKIQSAIREYAVGLEQ